MPRLYRSPYLTCFYCGRKNSTLYTPKTRRFECPFCDATNYLDEVR
jgi:transposase